MVEEQHLQRHEQPLRQRCLLTLHQLELQEEVRVEEGLEVQEQQLCQQLRLMKLHLLELLRLVKLHQLEPQEEVRMEENLGRGLEVAAAAVVEEHFHLWEKQMMRQRCLTLDLDHLELEEVAQVEKHLSLEVVGAAATVRDDWKLQLLPLQQLSSLVSLPWPYGTVLPSYRVVELFLPFRLSLGLHGSRR